MEKIYYAGQCPICHEYGRLEICKDVGNNQYLVICDECFGEWNNPEDTLNNIIGHRESIKKGEVLSATLDDIKNIGWDRFIVDK